MVKRAEVCRYAYVGREETFPGFAAFDWSVRNWGGDWGIRLEIGDWR